MSAGVDRLTRVNEILKREIADYLESGVVLFPSGVLVSVTSASCSVDLRNATVNVSVFGGGVEERRAVIKALLNRRVDLQRTISKDLCFKHTPKLSFQLDDSMAAADRVLQMLNEAEKTQDSGDE